ncbi:MAG: TetR/AcrR family transcriptional regulator [Pseudomonadales bacterium]|nr:TetR/AcrR family transcriptional regulator [Pseudomonadales bacterium]
MFLKCGLTTVKAKQKPEIQYPLRTKKKLETRNRIIQSALILLSSNPVSDVTLAMVSKDAGIHVTTVFTHFESRQALFVALSEPIIKTVGDQIEVSKGSVPFFDFLRIMQKSFAAAVVGDGSGIIAQALCVRSHIELLPAWLSFEKSQIEMFASYLMNDYGITKLQGRLVGGMIFSAMVYSFNDYLQNSNQDLALMIEDNIQQIETMFFRGLMSD